MPSEPESRRADPGQVGGPVTERPVVYSINLDADTERLARQVSMLDLSAVEHVRIPAIRGMSLPHAAMRFIPGADVEAPGTLGCFLSHMTAWETLLRSGRAGTVVLEDDAILGDGFNAAVPLLSGHGRDLLFLNDRLVPYRTEDPADTADREIAELAEVVESRGALKQIACGGDGYFLSAAGARALLCVVERHGVHGDVDWFLLLCALGQTGIDAIDSNRTFRRKLRTLQEFYRIAAPVLSAASLRQPLVRHGRGVSSRRQENAVARAGTADGA